jgi:hypothetical protein
VPDSTRRWEPFEAAGSTTSASLHLAQSHIHATHLCLLHPPRRDGFKEAIHDCNAMTTPDDTWRSMMSRDE